MKSSWHIVAAFLWVLLGPLVAILSFVLLFYFGPQVMWLPAVAYMNPGTSNEYHYVMLEVEGTQRGVWIEADVTIRGDSGESRAVVDLTTMHVLSAAPINSNTGNVIAGSGNTAPQPLTGREVLNWFGYAGSNVSNPALIIEATEIATIIQNIPSHQMNNPHTTHVTFLQRSPPSYGPPGWMVWALVLFWICAITGGVITHLVLADRGRSSYQSTQIGRETNQ